MSNKFLKFVLILVIAIAGATNASASIYLGSFKAGTNGQDTMARVIAAITVSDSAPSGLTFLFKNNYSDPGGLPGGLLEGPFQSAFSLTGNSTSGSISQVAPTLGFTPLYYTVKMGNKGFNLYKFSGSSNTFNNTHFGDGSLGAYYLTDTWSRGPGGNTNRGISHLSVWGVTAVTIPEPGSLLVWMTSMGCVGLIGLRRRRVM